MTHEEKSLSYAKYKVLAGWIGKSLGGLAVGVHLMNKPDRVGALVRHIWSNP